MHYIEFQTMSWYYSSHPKVAGGSGKRQLADGSCMHLQTIGKLRGLCVPLPPGRTGHRITHRKGCAQQRIVKRLRLRCSYRRTSSGNRNELRNRRTIHDPRRTCRPSGGMGRRWGLKIPCPQGRMGSNPISANAQASENQALTEASENQPSPAGGDLVFHSGSKGEIPADLAKLIEAWPTLPDDIRPYRRRPGTPRSGRRRTPGNWSASCSGRRRSKRTCRWAKLPPSSGTTGGRTFPRSFASATATWSSSKLMNRAARHSRAARSTPSMGTNNARTIPKASGRSFRPGWWTATASLPKI